MSTLPPLHPALQALVGQVLAGRYRIDAVLGQGGMGAVFRAQHLGLRRDVAVKVLHPELTSDETQKRRFEREARAASRLDHPNCIRVTDFGVTEANVTFLAMDLLVGTDLRAKLGVPLAIPRVIDFGLQIASGLAHAHAHGLVHRDLKPENIIVTRVAAGEQLKLVDFGIAKVLEGEGANDKLTRTGFAFGTPRYMSPEQATGGKIDEGVDLFALGLLMHEMCTGFPPFEADDSVSLLRKHVYEPAPALPTRVPPALAQVIQQLLAKVRAQRPASAQAVVDALSAASTPATSPRAPPQASQLGTAPTMADGAQPQRSLPGYALTAPGSSGPTSASAPPRNPVLAPMIATLVGGLVLVVLVTAFVSVRCAASASASGEPASPVGLVGAGDCGAQQSLAGRWDFTTTVMTSQQASALGVHGYYALDVEVTQCSARADVRKLGYDDVAFGDTDVQTGAAELRVGPPWWSAGLGGGFVLQSQRGNDVEQEFVFLAIDDDLFGYWRHRGAEWERARMSGTLRGRREGRGRVSPEGPQPCAVHCAIACDAHGRESDGELRNRSVSGCATDCEANPNEPARCR